MKEDIKNEYSVKDHTKSILTKEELDNTQEDIPDELLEEATGGTLGSVVLDVSHGVSRMSDTVRNWHPTNATKAAIGQTGATALAAGAVGAVASNLPVPGK